ncbi:hypothetical protein [Hymenobacter weizhouensis]|uniref:hypothetical protein n=1 Tax=Hymenobacter sp. YIM 151500-1 TaxID=2987689 RepID=UPI002227B703|nr:hypothetical protein [Hymenobacter sp. YIM 151500-1]UYZ62351.1 hypothetical protein OIS53_15290 [Hymenobacter sp. YIM 151500-1]
MLIFSRVRTATVVTAVFTGSLIGCSKEETNDTSPKPDQTQESKAAKVNAVWRDFVNKVKAGSIIDPIGQYVSDDTWVEAKEGKRSSRPKMDFAKRLTLDSNWANAKGIGGFPDMGTLKVPCEDRPDDPDCVFIPGPTTYFVSSEGQALYNGTDNPDGYIADLKIAWARNYDADAHPMDGYTSIRANLNSGAGGATMYLTFTRNPRRVRLGDSFGRTDRVTEGFVRNLQTLEAPFGDFIGNFPLGNLLPIQRPGGFVNQWNTPDLNDGAGGSYIYAYMVKDPAEGPPIEVGVLVSNNSNAQPPSGWRFVDGQDLNKGAGGDYVYFCSKPR